MGMYCPSILVFEPDLNMAKLKFLQNIKNIDKCGYNTLHVSSV